MSPWLRLIRLDRLVGFWLLLATALIGLWAAQGGKPPNDILIIFILGTFIMRSAGCILNDVADQDIDGAVTRTQNRPLATGELNTTQALALFAILSIVGFALAWQLNVQALRAAILAMPIILFYPYSKRYLPCPQLVLSLAFAWPIVMAYNAILGHMNTNGWLLFFVHAIWIIGYDTLYAMSDKPEDLKAGIRSMATWLGKHDAHLVWASLLLMLAGHEWVGHRMAMPPLWHIAMLVWWAAFLPLWVRIHKTRDPNLAFLGFRLNAILGMGTWALWAFFMTQGVGCHGLSACS